MSKGQLTRENILAQAAALFNTRGYAGASLSELMQITGLKKGGIYNHFHSKEEILISAFEYSVGTVKNILAKTIADEPTAAGKLKGIVEFYRNFALNPVIRGGCPILNTIVDSDSTNPILQEKVKIAVDDLIDELVRIINYGIRKGEFKSGINARDIAIIIFTSIEGGIAIARSHGETCYMDIMIDHLIKYIDGEVMA
jgi:TetR/AcrR family transcriptional regulator, transcriptional repressor for nem operon